jgi:RNA polymerase sigma-70 factor (ECF subfamily)
VSSSAVASAAEDANPAPAGSQERARAVEQDLARVYRDHHRFVYRSLVRLGVGEDRDDDALHDVFMVVARRLPEFERRARMRTWLFAIAMRVAQGIRRDAARDTRRREKVGANAVGGHEPHARADAARTLRDLLARLDEDKRAVFIMAELEGMTAPEIAGVLGVKVPTVYSRLRLAREELTRALERIRSRERRQR